MLEKFSRNDVAGTVNLSDPAAVADAVCHILGRSYPGFDENTVRKGFADIADACGGRYPGLLCCDTPYHDLRHFLDSALLMARMLDGYQITFGPHGSPSAEQCSVAVLLTLFHDVGMLRRDSESHLQGASLSVDHEQRSVDFMRDYLACSPLAHHAGQADLIFVTNFVYPVKDFLNGLSQALVVIGQMLGTADLVSQISGRYYLENCRDCLFREFVIAGTDRQVTSSGETKILYASPQDLLRRTPAFYENIIKKRLDDDLGQVYRHVAAHFGGDDPYARGIQRNLTHLQKLIATDDFSNLRRQPVRATLPGAGQD